MGKAVQFLEQTNQLHSAQTVHATELEVSCTEIYLPPLLSRTHCQSATVKKTLNVHGNTTLQFYHHIESTDSTTRKPQQQATLGDWYELNNLDPQLHGMTL